MNQADNEASQEAASDDSRGTATLGEIVGQTSAWARAYAQLTARADEMMAAWGAIQPRRVLVTGCGSSFHLAQSGAALLQGVGGLPARAVTASELALYPEQVLEDPATTLLIAISRSGQTTETLAAIDRFRAAGGQAVWAITCYDDTPLVETSDRAVVMEMAQEKSLVQTASFSTMLLVMQMLAAMVGGEELTLLAKIPEAGRRLIEGTYGLAHNWSTEAGIERFFFLGSGWLYGIANEATLKMIEMSLSHSESYPFLEFRHGPKAWVDAEAMIVGLISARTQSHEAAVMQELVKLGGNTIALAPGRPRIGHVTIHLPEEAPAWAIAGLYLPVVQSMAYARAMHKGLDPDQPRHLTSFVALDRASLGA